jgi:hypothetical protein
MLGPRVHWASFVQDFFKLSLIAPRVFAPRIALNSRDFLVWLALSGITRVVLLALVEVVLLLPYLSLLRLGKRSFSSSSYAAHHAIM